MSDYKTVMKAFEQTKYILNMLAAYRSAKGDKEGANVYFDAMVQIVDDQELFAKYLTPERNES